jgi:hypothetical protein
MFNYDSLLYCSNWAFDCLSFVFNFNNWFCPYSFIFFNLNISFYFYYNSRSLFDNFSYKFCHWIFIYYNFCFVLAYEFFNISFVSVKKCIVYSFFYCKTRSFCIYCVLSLYFNLISFNFNFNLLIKNSNIEFSFSSWFIPVI